MWIAVKGEKRKLIRKDFGDDYASAEELYLRVREAKKVAATLACVNMGFPPPVHLRSHLVTKRGRDKRTRKIRTVTVEVQPLKQLNHEGKLWCPYCRALRPFVLRRTATVRNVKMQDTRYVCPICGVSHRDHNVRLWNPTAALHMASSVASLTRRRSSRSTTNQRRRRR